MSKILTLRFSSISPSIPSSGGFLTYDDHVRFRGRAPAAGSAPGLESARRYRASGVGARPPRSRQRGLTPSTRDPSGPSPHKPLSGPAPNFARLARSNGPRIRSRFARGLNSPYPPAPALVFSLHERAAVTKLPILQRYRLR